ncbi:tRNA pseudouridine(38/39) synthase [Malassezia cuniculi]|uniref:tRNA pseudouridine(38/39) synthase n=1 Tax=Malassezia cuniculi TaxID=948313 RepID=A0AAF0ET23_9BASI|nr:tRNA pseudouridine(38/39) synthase [Malassezia cuniculi]
MDALWDWCDHVGILVDTRLELCRVTDDDEFQARAGTYALVAEENIGPGELLVHIPDDAVLSKRTLPQTYKGAEELALALHLLCEQQKGSASRFYGYLSSLPHVSLPLIWHGTDTAEAYWMGGTEAERIVRRAEHAWSCGLCAGFCLARLRSYWRDNHAAAGLDVELWPRYIDAFALVSSRAFVLNEWHGLAMVPVADLFNHTDAPTVHVEADSKLSGSYTPGVIVRSVGAIAAGEEAINSYGALSNPELLCRYGFVLDARTGWERSSWDCHVPDERQEILDAFGLSDSSKVSSRALAALGPPSVSIQQEAECSVCCDTLKDDDASDEHGFAPVLPRDSTPLFIDAIGRPSWPLWMLACGAALKRGGTIPDVVAALPSLTGETDAPHVVHAANTAIAKLCADRLSKIRAATDEDGALDTLSRARKLLQRIAQLEANAAAAGQPSPDPAPNTTSALDEPKKAPRKFDVSQYPCRKIALRFSYDGAYYSGLAAQPAPTPLPTVEETIWNAMCTARLVDSAGTMEDTDWSRCGRTDAGVSAAGQVIALWVRSRRVDERPLRYKTEGQDPVAVVLDEEAEELPYVATLNRLLPHSIRMQAWSPVSPDFSSRFDCTYRHYKYFFTLGAPASLTRAPDSGAHFVQRLDLERMRDAASRLVGEHDFRNMCKVDASKQITNFCRRIDGATIDRVPQGWGAAAPTSDDVAPDDEPMYVLNLRGSAFLYHQVRHIMSVLFMVGAGLEEPSIVDELVNVAEGAAAADRIRTHEWLAEEQHKGNVDAQTPDKVRNLALDAPHSAAVYETKPSYEMAADRPLMLWECGFRDKDIGWRASTYDGPLSDAPEDYSAALRAMSQLHASWTRESIHAELVRHMLFAGMTPLDVVKTRLQTQEVAPLEFPIHPKARELALNSAKVCEEFAGVNSLRLSLMPAQHSAACIQIPGQCVCGYELVQQRPMRGMWDGIYKIFRFEGVRGLWRGFLPTVVMTVPSQVTYMTCYDAFRSLLTGAPSLVRGDDTVSYDGEAPIAPVPGEHSAPYQLPTFVTLLIAGAGARAISATMVTPLELLRTRLQASHARDNMSSVMRTIGREVSHSGVGALWRGLGATLWRDVPFSAIYFASYETGKTMLTGGGLGESRAGGFSQEFAISFAVGGTSGCVAALCTHPFDVLKTRLQADAVSSVDNAARRMGLGSALAHIVRTEGVQGLFCGLTPRLAKVVPASGIMIGSFEVVGRLLSRMRTRSASAPPPSPDVHEDTH